LIDFLILLNPSLAVIIYANTYAEAEIAKGLKVSSYNTMVACVTKSAS